MIMLWIKKDSAFTAEWDHTQFRLVEIVPRSWILYADGRKVNLINGKKLMPWTTAAAAMTCIDNMQQRIIMEKAKAYAAASRVSHDVEVIVRLPVCRRVSKAEAVDATIRGAKVSRFTRYYEDGGCESGYMVEGVHAR